MQQSSLIHSLAILFIFLRLLVPLNGYPIIGEHVYNKATTVVPITPSSLASTMSPSHETAPSPSTTKPIATEPMSQSIISSSTKAVDFKSSSPATTSAAATETPSTSQLAAPSADSTSPVVTDSMFEQLMMMKNPRGKSHAKWNHKDTVSWGNVHQGCAGNRQSPVDIQPKSTMLTALPKFVFHNYENLDNMTLTNNGHTALYSLPDGFPKEKIPFLTGGGLTEKFEFVQFHLHWGSDSTKGSEHQVKSQSFPGELHIVHFNTKYPSFTEASKFVDGLAVLGIFIKIGPNDSPSFQSIVEQLNEVILNGAETTLRKAVPLHDLLPRRTASFYRYMGSLTTPACEEVVVWSVFDTPIVVSEKQIAMLRQLIADDGAPLVDNFRRTMPLNGRIIKYRSFTGCEISNTWPVTSSPFTEAFKWSKCLMNFAFQSVFSS